MKKILITGASSFYGSHLLKQLKDSGYNILATANHENKDKDIIKADLTEIDQLRNVVNKFLPDIVIHIGALVDLSRDFTIGKQCIEVNTIGTMNVLEVVKEYNPLVIYISSEEVYGNTPIPFIEDQTVDPPSPYAISKIAAEYFCKWYGIEYNFPVIIVRLGTLYGLDQPSHKYFRNIIECALKNAPIPCNSGQKLRDYLYVNDGVDLIKKIIENGQEKTNELKENNIINGTGGIAYSLLQVIDTIKKLTNSSSIVQIGAIPDRITERNEWLADISKAKKVFGWEPKVNLENGLKTVIDYINKKHE